VLKAVAATLAAAATLALPAAERCRRITYSDLQTPIRERFAAHGIGEREFPEYVSRVEAETDRRVAEGEREHLIHYALQSTRFTTRPSIEPAVSARRFVESLSESERRRMLEDPTYLPNAGWPGPERARAADLVDAFDGGVPDPRVDYFKQLVERGGGKAPVDDLYRDYVRVARFLYLKESLASTSPPDVEQIARLYQTRPHSSDTQAEAGFGVYLGLGAMQGLDSKPGARVESVLIVGPGMDLAPRIDLIDLVAPQSYQPFAVADALLLLSLASERNLHIHSIDVNPRVVTFLQSVFRGPLTLHLFTGVAETVDRPFSQDYRAYARQLGLAVGSAVEAPRPIAAADRYLRSIVVRASVTRTMAAERLNIITERLVDRTGFDLIVATNVLTYFDDDQLALALSNITAMLQPGGYFLHNESRADLAETAGAVGLPVLHTRSAVIGGPASRPLYDAVWLHRKAP